jgi:hypothetical protein
MIKSYRDYIKPETMIYEANVKNLVKREDLAVGDDVMTTGNFDGVELDYQVGKIIRMKEYGNLLIEFKEPFSKKFHAGHKNVGKDKHCFYIPLANIASNNKEEFEKIIKRVGDEKLNRVKRLNAVYKPGDVIVGVGEAGKKGVYNNVPLDGEIGVVYYPMGAAAGTGNLNYWVGFLDKFDQKGYLRPDNDGLPTNGAGMAVDKLHMRPAEPDEIEKVQDKLDKINKQLEGLKKEYKDGDVIIANGTCDGVKFEDWIGIVKVAQGMNPQGRGGYGYGNGGGYGYGNGAGNRYMVQYLERYHNYMYDQGFGTDTCYSTVKSIMREATPEEIEKFKGKIERLQERIKIFNHEYKKGDYVMGVGSNGYNALDGLLGIVNRIEGHKPQEYFYINWITKTGIPPGNAVYRKNLSPILGEDAKEIKRKLDAKEIMPFMASEALMMILNRIDLPIRSPFSTLSYFDVVKDKNDMVTYLPLDKFKRLEDKEDPYKSRLRQPMKIGKFFRVLDDKIIEKDVEKAINGFRAMHDICISNSSENLRLVSGEAIRFWYYEGTYVTGGGRLNNSCMKGKGKGPEMQMFVDNPQDIEMLILTNPENKLLGRALVWHLTEPEGKVYMDYIYTRFDKDIELFKLFAKQRGWYSADGGRPPGTIVCSLTSDTKYVMGRNALDHFDGMMLYSDKWGQYLSLGGNRGGERKNPPPKKIKPLDDKVQ